MLQGLGNVVNCNEVTHFLFPLLNISQPLLQVYERMGLRELRDLRERKYRPGHKRRPLRHKRRRPNTAVITEVRHVI